MGDFVELDGVFGRFVGPGEASIVAELVDRAHGRDLIRGLPQVEPAVELVEDLRKVAAVARLRSLGVSDVGNESRPVAAGGSVCEFTVTQVASMLGITSRAVRYRITRGVLSARRAGGILLVQMEANGG